MRKIGYIFIVIITVFFLYAPFDAEFSKREKPDLDITFGQTDPADIIYGCRHNLDCLSKSTNSNDVAEFIMDRPKWTFENNTESFDMIYSSQHNLLQNGKVVWAAIVLANEDLFKGAGEQLPAAIVYSFDPFFDSQPQKLNEISDLIFTVKANSSDSELNDFANIVSDKKKVILNTKVPNCLTDNKECNFCFIIIDPDFLPDGRLSKRLLPVLAIPGQDTALLLPDEFWDQRLVDFYK